MECNGFRNLGNDLGFFRNSIIYQGYKNLYLQSLLKLMARRYFIYISFVILAGLLEAFRLDEFQYDIQQSKQFQSYCVITHCDKAMLENWTCKICNKLTQIKELTYIRSNLTDVVGIVGFHQKLNSIIVAFRGTQSRQNWIQDLSYYQVPYPRCKDCKVHEGFYAAYLSISAQLKSQIQKLMNKYPNTAIYSIGSSLGASIAEIAAIQFQLQFGNVKEFHSFGCPRVGDENFVKFLTQKVKIIRRVIHNKDIVPHVPLASQNFAHPPFEIWFDANMQNYKVCNDSGEDPACSNSLFPDFSTKDHTSYWQPSSVVSDYC